MADKPLEPSINYHLFDYSSLLVVHYENTANDLVCRVTIEMLRQLPNTTTGEKYLAPCSTA